MQHPLRHPHGGLCIGSQPEQRDRIAIPSRLCRIGAAGDRWGNDLGSDTAGAKGKVYGDICSWSYAGTDLWACCGRISDGCEGVEMAYVAAFDDCERTLPCHQNVNRHLGRHG